jgi:hypothetical protein
MTARKPEGPSASFRPVRHFYRQHPSSLSRGHPPLPEPGTARDLGRWLRRFTAPGSWLMGGNGQRGKAPGLHPGLTPSPPGSCQPAPWKSSGIPGPGSEMEVKDKKRLLPEKEPLIGHFHNVRFGPHRQKIPDFKGMTTLVAGGTQPVRAVLPAAAGRGYVRLFDRTTQLCLQWISESMSGP